MVQKFDWRGQRLETEYRYELLFNSRITNSRRTLALFTILPVPHNLCLTNIIVHMTRLTLSKLGGVKSGTRETTLRETEPRVSRDNRMEVERPTGIHALLGCLKLEAMKHEMSRLLSSLSLAVATPLCPIKHSSLSSLQHPRQT